MKWQEACYIGLVSNKTSNDGGNVKYTASILKNKTVTKNRNTTYHGVISSQTTNQYRYIAPSHQQ